MKTLWATWWIAWSGAFILCEFGNLSVTYWCVPAALGVSFMTVELYCAFMRNGGTFSEAVWQFSDRGFKIAGFAVRTIPAWLLTVAMALRVAATARLIDGDDVTLVYWSDHLPLDLFLTGTVLWLAAHFYSLGEYGDGDD